MYLLGQGWCWGSTIPIVYCRFLFFQHADEQLISPFSFPSYTGIVSPAVEIQYLHCKLISVKGKTV